MRQPKDINTLLTLAEQGDNRACMQLGLRYYYGCDGVEQNYEEAVKYFIAADDKDMLGECYLRGFGVERDVNKTIELWEAACEEHFRYYDVMFKLAHLYGDGIEIEPDYKKALCLWYQLAENDSGEFGEEGAFAEAMYQLACYYYEGKGVEKSLKWALKYFKYTIELFSRERCDIHHLRKSEGNITNSGEPDFIIHARKVLVKHGCRA